MDFLEDEINLPSVFEDETKLSSQYIPENLMFRSTQLKFLARFFKAILSEFGNSKKLILYGDIGSGKTSIVKKFGMWVTQRQNKIKIEYIHINCRNHKRQYSIMLTIARSLNSHIPSRGFSSQELIDIVIDLLEARSITLLLALDEVDYINNEELTNLIYSLTRTNDDKKFVNHNVSLIIISRSLSFLERLDLSTKSSLSAGKLYLKPYNSEQLEDILNDRVIQSFKVGSVSNEAIKLAAEISGHNGDARLALELMWFAGKHADQIGSSILYPDYVRVAKSNINPIGIKRSIGNLEKHQLLLLLGITRQLQFTKKTFLSTGSAKEAYNLVCEELEIIPRKHTQLWQYLKELTNLDLIVTETSGKGHRGKTQYISIEDVSVKELEKEVNKTLNQIKNTSYH